MIHLEIQRAGELFNGIAEYPLILRYRDRSTRLLWRFCVAGVFFFCDFYERVFSEIYRTVALAAPEQLGLLCAVRRGCSEAVSHSLQCILFLAKRTCDVLASLACGRNGVGYVS